MAKTKSQELLDKLTTNNKTYSNLRFPRDIDFDGNMNVMRFNISLPTASKYLGNGSYQSVVDPATGTSRSSDYRSNQSRGSIQRRFSEKYSRITTSIDLYMPPKIESSYQSDWNTAELGSAGAIADAFFGTMNSNGFTGGAEKTWEVFKENFGTMALNTAAGTVQGITPINAKDAKRAITGTIANPYMEVMFNGVQHRTFSFTFKMIPRSAAEQQTIKDIVHEFKFHAAPEWKSDTNNAYMRFPSEFDITFIHKNQENPWLFKISTCALTNVSVDYSPEGQYAGHADGSPFATELTLSFTELELLSKNRIQDGY